MPRMCYNNDMGVYLHNSGLAPKTFGTHPEFPPQNYTVISDDLAAKLRQAGIQGIEIEGDEAFDSLWVRNVPAKTPDRL